MTPTCLTIREEILHIAKVSGHGHIPTCFSVVEILCAIYSTIRHDPQNPQWPARDIFILSKGHAALALYTVLAHFGYFDSKRLDAFGAFLSDFGCHADRLKIPGIEVSTGSLGHGIGLAVGTALALRIKKEPRHVVTLIGDGEANEGSVWEALLVAVDLGLQNLTVFYDDNQSHGRGLQIRDAAAHFAGFGCQVVETDGHDIVALTREVINQGPTVKVVVAHTQKGFGCPTFIQNHYEWHRRSPNEQEYCQLLKELHEETI